MTVRLEKEGKVGVIVLDRPPANSYDYAFLRELAGAIDDARLDGDVRNVVVTSASEKFFSAGADVKAFQSEPHERNMEMIGTSHRTLSSIEEVRNAWAHWPPHGVETVPPWQLPLVNTLTLLLSGTTVTWAHHALLENDRQGLKWGLICTVLLGLTFTCVQGWEYYHAHFNYSGHIYGATFFMATGFHGAHVIIGSIFLIVCTIRAFAGHFNPKQHLGFEFAAWYWHFVDVVWLFLFACIYVWGGGTPLHH